MRSGKEEIFFAGAGRQIRAYEKFPLITVSAVPVKAGRVRF